MGSSWCRVQESYRRYESFFQSHDDDVPHRVGRASGVSCSARRQERSDTQSLVSCKKHHQSLIQSLISVSARGDHVWREVEPQDPCLFWKIFCSGTVGSSWCRVQESYRRYESFFQSHDDDVPHRVGRASGVSCSARRQERSDTQSLVSCKKHHQSLIQSLISVSARGDHVWREVEPQDPCLFWKIFCSGTVGSSWCRVQES